MYIYDPTLLIRRPTTRPPASPKSSNPLTRDPKPQNPTSRTPHLKQQK